MKTLEKKQADNSVRIAGRTVRSAAPRSRLPSVKTQIDACIRIALPAEPSNVDDHFAPVRELRNQELRSSRPSALMPRWHTFS